MFDFDVLKISEASDSDDDDGRGQAREQTREQARAAGAIGLSTVQLDVSVAAIPRGPALTLSPEAAVATAIEAMRRRSRGAAVVVQNHRPVGVVTDRSILAQACGKLEDLGTVPIGAVMSPCAEPLREADTVGTALRSMCAQRQWHLPIVCNRGLFLGALDIADISLWLRDRLTLISVDAVFAHAHAAI
jgi:CBS domain-containing protein